MGTTPFIIILTGVMNFLKFIVSNHMEESFSKQRVNPLMGLMASFIKVKRYHYFEGVAGSSFEFHCFSIPNEANSTDTDVNGDLI